MAVAESILLVEQAVRKLVVARGDGALPRYQLRVQAEAYCAFTFSLINDRRLRVYQARLDKILAQSGFAIVALGDFGGGTGDGALCS